MDTRTQAPLFDPATAALARAGQSRGTVGDAEISDLRDSQGGRDRAVGEGIKGRARGMAVKPKTKACRVCKAEYVPQRIGQRVCSPGCALALAKSDRAKSERKAEVREKRETRARLESMKTVPQLIAEADKAFCAYIRARDAGKPCICCGSVGKTTSLTGGEWDAGHYRSRGAASHLRYDERNCHAQLKRCNRRAFDVASYRRNLIERIGPHAVDRLETDNRPHKWTRDELRQIRDEYREKRRALEAQR